MAKGRKKESNLHASFPPAVSCFHCRYDGLWERCWVAMLGHETRLRVYTVGRSWFVNWKPVSSYLEAWVTTWAVRRAFSNNKLISWCCLYIHRIHRVQGKPSTQSDHLFPSGLHPPSDTGGSAFAWDKPWRSTLDNFRLNPRKGSSKSSLHDEVNWWMGSRNSCALWRLRIHWVRYYSTLESNIPSYHIVLSRECRCYCRKSDLVRAMLYATKKSNIEGGSRSTLNSHTVPNPHREYR